LRDVDVEFLVGKLVQHREASPRDSRFETGKHRSHGGLVAPVVAVLVRDEDMWSRIRREHCDAHAIGTRRYAPPCSMTPDTVRTAAT
jgi:hypothetical protein